MSRVEEARARAARLLAQAETEDALLAQLPHLRNVPWKVGATKLYGSVGYATLEPSDRFTLDPAKRCTVWPTDVQWAASLLPPRPLALLKGACTSFRPRETLGEVSERDSDEEVAPFVVQVERDTMFDGTTFDFTWFAQLPAGLVDVSVRLNGLSVEKVLGRIELLWGKNGHGDPERDTITRCTYAPPKGWRDLGGQETIRWASGGARYPNRFTVYWRDPAVTPQAALKAVGW